MSLESGQAPSPRDVNAPGEATSYHALNSGRTVFERDLRALLGRMAGPQKPDRPAVLSFLLLGVLHGHRTGFSGVHRLVPGRLVETRRGRPCLRPLPSGTRGGRPADFQAAVRRFRELSDEAMEQALRGRGRPMAVALSGGLDSSALLYSARRILGDLSGLTAVTYVFEGRPDNDDIGFAGLVARATGIRHETVELRYEDLDRSARKAVQTVADLSDFPLLPQVAFFERLVQLGFHETMHGAGPDFTQHRITQSPWLRAWNLMQAAPSFLREPLAALLRTVPSRGFHSQALRSLGHGRLSWLWLLVYAQLSPAGPARGCPRPLWEELIRSPGVRLYTRSDRPGIRSAEGHLYPAQAFLGAQLMRQMELVAEGLGLSLRLPWMAQPLIEFLMSCPSSWKQGGLDGKALLRESEKAEVPDVVRERPKRAFQSFFPLEWRDRWTSPGEPGAELAEHVRRSGLLTAEEFRWFYEHPRRRFRLALLGLWLRTWF